ncbi:cation channel family protein [Stylonychia lemnae]|uniref:Cation channel family protein n=1 Tax=Stylonychia lemnae TaxID=5949 RepID=A0A077ZRB1_STYLE|nr:cation channel family protein [Stylonychia lemnae]|eukprot:CDW72458.1 cation channel family protein [Stylonychia lemnae]
MSYEEKQAELIRRRKLLYGVKDIEKLISKSRETQQYMQKSKQDQSTSSSNKKSKDCKDRLIISQRSQCKAFFDIWMLILVGYSCFTTIYQYYYIDHKYSVSFGIEVDGVFSNIDDVVTGFFGMDLLTSNTNTSQKSSMLIDFMMEYQDQETFQMIRDHKKIAKKYIMGGWFFIDFAATFPINYVVGGSVLWSRLLRLFRLPQLIKILDLSRFNRSSNRQDRIVAQYILMYSYKIFRLIIIAIIITYFVGCFWYLISSNLNSDDNYDQSFVAKYFVDVPEDYDRLIISCYFALTTLSTVGYGDLVPQTQVEMIFGILVMLCGVGFFSYIMSSFIEIISNYDKKMGAVDKGTELHNWMTLLTRFTNNKPLPKSLINQIDNHFSYYWNNDRLASLSKKNEYLNALPRSIKRNVQFITSLTLKQIMIHYLFDDIFYKFRFFFNSQKYKDSKFLYDISFGLKPRKFETNDDEKLIYDEEDEVSEMYFIQEGTVGIGYYLFSQGLSKKQYKLGIFMKDNSFICDYYVCNNKKSEFIFIAVSEVKAFALSKRFLLHNIFEKYPDIASEIKEQSYYRYKKNVKNRLIKHRQEHLEEINKKSSYKYIQVREKSDGAIIHQHGGEKPSQGNLESRAEMQNDIKLGKEQGETDLNSILKRRIEGIQNEMSKFNQNISEFAETCDTELNNLIGNINLLQRNLGYLNQQFQQQTQ